MTSPSFVLATQHTVQIADYPAGSSFGPRRLNDFEVVWLVAGSAQLTVDGTHGGQAVHALPLHPGDVAIVRPGERDRYVWDRNVPTRHAYAHFELKDAAGLHDPQLWPRVRRFADFPVLEGLTEYLLALAGSSDTASQDRSVQVLHWLVDLFVCGPVPNDALAGLPPPVAATLERVRAIWANDGLRLISVTELAAHGHVSTGHLHRLFQTSFGCGPARCLEMVRLWQAATALRRSAASVGEVGVRCGYPDRFHFSRRFRGLYGTPPRSVRTADPAIDPAAPLRSNGLLGVAHHLLSGPTH